MLVEGGGECWWGEVDDVGGLEVEGGGGRWRMLGEGSGECWWREVDDVGGGRWREVEEGG